MKERMNIFDDSGWSAAPEYPKGTQKKILHEEEGVQTALIKLPAGFYMEPHSHIHAEQHFVLKGEYLSGGEVSPEGTYQSYKAHEEHGPFESKKGALVLVIWFSGRES